MPRLTATQAAALDLMRTRHDGTLRPGEGFTVSTARVLARAGLCTLDGSGFRSRYTADWTATLTQAGWAGHTRPPAPVVPDPTPEAELRPGDTVANIHTGNQGTWHGDDGRGGYVVHVLGGAVLHVPAGCYRLVSRPASPAPAPEPAQPLDGPHTAAQAPLDREEPLPDGYYDARTRTHYQPGTRVTYRTRDGFWIHGHVTHVFRTPHDRTPAVHVTLDARQVAPARRAQPLIENRPGPRKPDHGVWTAKITDRDLTPEQDMTP